MFVFRDGMKRHDALVLVRGSKFECIALSTLTPSPPHARQGEGNKCLKTGI
jgi:hypothetical protein